MRKFAKFTPMKITYFGHSCFLVEIKGKKIIFDPFISPNPLAKHIDVNAISADYILLSHAHEDHIADALSIAKRTGAKIISNWEICMWANKNGITNFHPMNIGGKIKLDFGNVKSVVAIHSSSFPDGTYGGNPMGFVIESSEKNFYYAGDTALTYDMKLIGNYRQIDFSFLPIGDNFTMSVDNAIIATDFLKCDKVIGMHYNTFDLIKINEQEAVEKFKNRGKELILIPIGNSIEL